MSCLCRRNSVEEGTTRAAINSAGVWCEVPRPLTVTSIPTAGGHGTVVHCLRRHAQLGGRVPSGLGWGLLPRGRASHFLLSSTPAVATTNRMEGLGAYREALSTGEGLRMRYGHAFLGVRHGNGAHTQVLAFSCYVLTRPKTETGGGGNRHQWNRCIYVYNTFIYINQWNMIFVCIIRQNLEPSFHIILWKLLMSGDCKTNIPHPGIQIHHGMSSFWWAYASLCVYI